MIGNLIEGLQKQVGGELLEKTDLISEKNSETPEDDPSPINTLFGDSNSLKDKGIKQLTKYL